MTYDTNDKTCEVRVNGQVVENIRYVSVGKYGDKEAHLIIETMTDENDGMVTYTQVTASEDEIKKASAAHRNMLKVGDVALIETHSDAVKRGAYQLFGRKK